MKLLIISIHLFMEVFIGEKFLIIKYLEQISNFSWNYWNFISFSLQLTI